MKENSSIYSAGQIGREFIAQQKFIIIRVGPNLDKKHYEIH